MEDMDFMAAALDLARQAADNGDVPVGCVIVRRGEIVGRGRNRREENRVATAHAEILAIEDACRNLGGWRLWECTMYVTLEPCPMCAGAILNARIPRVVCAARDAKSGACGSVTDLYALPWNHHPNVEYGLGEAESQALLTDFFRQLRRTWSSRPKWRKPE